MDAANKETDTIDDLQYNRLKAVSFIMLTHAMGNVYVPAAGPAFSCTTNIFFVRGCIIITPTPN